MGKTSVHERTWEHGLPLSLIFDQSACSGHEDSNEWKQESYSTITRVNLLF